MGNTIKHLQEGNLARLQQVTIELLEPETGKVMGSIPDVNFVEGMEQMPVEKSIGETLRELESEVVEQTIETPSPTMKTEQKRHLEEQKEKEKKSALRSSLGSEKGKSAASPAGRQTPMERSTHFSPEGAPLFSNPE